MRNWVEKLERDGLWNGPQGYLVRKLVRASQIMKSQAFMGEFEAGAFDGISGLNNATVINIGKPGVFWQLREGIDRIRNSSGELQVFGKQINELNYRNQLIEPEIFQCHVQVNGLSSIGLEIACQLAKMGVRVMSLYDPEIGSSEIFSSRYRVTDAHKERVLSAQEILGESALCEVVECYRKYIDEEDEFGNVIVNGSSDIEVRRSLWNLIKGNEKIGLYIDAQVSGEKGRIFAFRPSDKIGIDIYEMDLKTSRESQKEIIYMTGLVGSFAVMIFKKYMTTSGNARHIVFDRVFYLDVDMMAVSV